MGIINPAELDLKEEVVVKINRTAKVTSRGKRFRFSALVVVGDGNGHVGVGRMGWKCYRRNVLA